MKFKHLFVTALVTGLFILLYSSCSKKADTSNSTTASFTFTGANTAAPATVIFTNTSTNAISYLWSFGDNSTSTQTSPSHAYTAGGTYQVVLQAINGTTVVQSTQSLTILNSSVGGQYLCTGKSGTNPYMPLAVGNVWTYGFNYYVPGGDQDTYTVKDTAVYNGKTYFHVHCYFAVTQSTGERYFRVDASNNVYEYANGTENLFLPSSPTVGQDLGTVNDFEGSSSFDRKVISINGSVTTHGCTYTNCLVIQDVGAITTDNDYFVQGLGCVYSIDYQLAGATLK